MPAKLFGKSGWIVFASLAAKCYSGFTKLLSDINLYNINLLFVLAQAKNKKQKQSFTTSEFKSLHYWPQM